MLRLLLLIVLVEGATQAHANEEIVGRAHSLRKIRRHGHHDAQQQLTAARTKVQGLCCGFKFGDRVRYNGLTVRYSDRDRWLHTADDGVIINPEAHGKRPVSNSNHVLFAIGNPSAGVHYEVAGKLLEKMIGSGEYKYLDQVEILRDLSDGFKSGSTAKVIDNVTPFHPDALLIRNAQGKVQKAFENEIKIFVEPMVKESDMRKKLEEKEQQAETEVAKLKQELQDQLDATHKEREEVQLEQERLKSELKETQEARDQTSAELENTKKNVEDKNDENRKLQLETDKLKENAKQLESDHQATKESHKQQISDMQKDHDKAHGELTKSLSEKDAALQKSQDELARKNEELTGTKTAHDKKILDMQKDHDRVQDALTAKEDALRKSEKDLKVKEAELMKEAADAATYKEELAILKSSLREQEEERKEREAKNQLKVQSFGAALKKTVEKGHTQLDFSLENSHNLCATLDVHLAGGAVNLHFGVSGAVTMEASRSNKEGTFVAEKLHFTGMVAGGVSLNAILLRASFYVQGTWDITVTLPPNTFGVWGGLKFMLGRIYDRLKGTKKSKLAHYFEKNKLDKKTADIVATITDLKQNELKNDLVKLYDDIDKNVHVTMREIEIADLNPVGCPTAAPGAAAGTPPPACMCDDPQIAPTKPKIADDCKNFCAKNDECQFVEYLRNGGSPICNWFKECIKGSEAKSPGQLYMVDKATYWYRRGKKKLEKPNNAFFEKFLDKPGDIKVSQEGLDKACDELGINLDYVMDQNQQVKDGADAKLFEYVCDKGLQHMRHQMVMMVEMNKLTRDFKTALAKDAHSIYLELKKAKKETAKDEVLQQGLLKVFYDIYLKSALPKYSYATGWPTPKCEALIKHPKTDYRHVLMCYFFTRGALIEGKLYRKKWIKPGHANIEKMLRPVYGALWRKEPEVADDPDAKTSWELTEKWLTTAAYWVNKGEYDVDKDKLQFSMAAAVNELLSLGKHTLLRRLKVTRGDLFAEEAGCLKTCQCGITAMTADYTFGMTIGSDPVGFCTPDSNMIQYTYSKHKSWRSVLTESTVYWPKQNGGQDVQHLPPKCEWQPDEDPSYRHTFTFAFGQWFQIDFWISNILPTSNNDQTRERGATLRFLFQGDGPDKKEMEKFANYEDGGTFEDLYNQLTDSNKLSIFNKNWNTMDHAENTISDWAKKAFSDKPITDFVGKISRFGLPTIDFKGLLSKLSKMGAVQINDDQYFGIDVGLEWTAQPNNGLPGSYIIRKPEAWSISFYTMAQRGAKVTAGSPTVAASLGFWISDTTRFTVQHTFEKKFLQTPFFKENDTVEFRLDENSSWVEGTIEAVIDGRMDTFYRIRSATPLTKDDGSTIPNSMVDRVNQNNVRKKL